MQLVMRVALRPPTLAPHRGTLHALRTPRAQGPEHLRLAVQSEDTEILELATLKFIDAREDGLFIGDTARVRGCPRSVYDIYYLT